MRIWMILCPLFCAAALLCATSAQAEELPAGVIGAVETYTVQEGDSLSAVARHFDIGAVELLAANAWLTSPKLAAGQVLTIPRQRIVPDAGRAGIVVNLAELRLFYFAPGDVVMTYPISIGRAGWTTPTGKTDVVLKRRNPTWTPPASLRRETPSLPPVVPPGPRNPLGNYALSLGWNGYLIHSTNQPSSIGKPASHGCIRMYPEDIEVLFEAVAVGTPVTVVDVPFKLGWLGNDLYLQVTPTQAQSAAIARYRTPEPLPADDPNRIRLQSDLSVLEAQGFVIDHAKVDAAIERHDGVPVMILKVE